MKAHPDINASLNKEPHFYSRNFDKGGNWYASNWEKKKGIAGECSTSYLYDRQALERIRHFHPEARIVVMLREPFDRALSHLRHLAREKRTDPQGLLEAHPEVISNSLYGSHLANVLALFPREQILMLFYDELAREPRTLLERLFRFVGADPEVVPAGAERVVGGGFEPRSKGMERVRKRIYDRFKQGGFHKGIHWVKKTGLSALYRKLNDRSETHPEGTKAPDKVLKPYIPRFREDLSAFLEQEELTERERSALAEWGDDPLYRSAP